MKLNALKQEIINMGSNLPPLQVVGKRITLIDALTNEQIKSLKQLEWVIENLRNKFMNEVESIFFDRNNLDSIDNDFKVFEEDYNDIYSSSAADVMPRYVKDSLANLGITQRSDHNFEVWLNFLDEVEKVIVKFK